MEKAIKFRKPRELNGIDIERADRLYFGEEFCERLLPTEKQLEMAKKAASDSNKKFSFLTPPVTDYGLEKFGGLLDLLDKEDELIVNDYGILGLTSKKVKNPIRIGRLLGRSALLTLRAANDRTTPKETLALFGKKIEGMEVDFFNLNHANKFPQGLLDFALHLGPFFWTTTRRCAFNPDNKSLNKFSPCKRECLNYKVVLGNKLSDKEFILEGNRILDVGDNKERINPKMIGRLVYELRR